MLYQPVDGVVGVGGVVNGLAAFIKGILRAHIDVFTLGHEFAAHILEDKNIAFFLEDLAGPQLGFVLPQPIRCHPVGRALHQDRVFILAVVGDVDGSKQLGAVAHRYLVFVLGVMGADIRGPLFFFFLFGVFRCLRKTAQQCGGQQAQDDRNSVSMHRFILIELSIAGFLLFCCSRGSDRILPTGVIWRQRPKPG